MELLREPKRKPKRIGDDIDGGRARACVTPFSPTWTDEADIVLSGRVVGVGLHTVWFIRDSVNICL